MGNDLDWVKDTSQVEVIHELMRLLTAYEHLNGKFANGKGDNNHRRIIMAPSRDETARARKVTIILYGMFQPEEITMPYEIEDTKESLLIANAHPSLENSSDGFSLNELDFYIILSVMDFHSRSSTHDRYGEHPDPPPTLDL